MKTPGDYNFVIFGRIIHGAHFIRELKRFGFPKPLVICSLDEEYLRERRLLSEYGLWADFEQFEKDNLCFLHKLKTVNCDRTFVLLKKYNCNIAFSINSRDIIKKPIIDYFDGEIFNIHDSYLPNERGSALNTWRILNGVNSVGDTIHYLEEGIDSGPIILRKETIIDKETSYPIDYLLAEVSNCKELLTSFIELFLKHDKLPFTDQDHDSSLYFPRQYTELNGLINWDWEISDIEKFVRAFSYPYPGAFSFYRSKKIHILECCADPTMTKKFHPYCNGRIVTNMVGGDVRIIAGGHCLLIRKVMVGGEKFIPSEVLSPKFLFNSPPQDLFEAKGLIPTTQMMAKDEIDSVS